MTALLCILVTFYLGFHAMRMDPRPEDRKEGEIAEGAGELGFFPPYSWWPLWAAAAQLICVAGHAAVLISPEGMRRAYWAMTQVPPYIQLTALFLGAVWHARRFERIGPYRSWRYT